MPIASFGVMFSPYRYLNNTCYTIDFTWHELEKSVPYLPVIYLLKLMSFLVLIRIGG